jgi:hypothetical protein
MLVQRDHHSAPIRLHHLLAAALNLREQACKSIDRLRDGFSEVFASNAAGLATVMIEGVLRIDRRELGQAVGNRWSAVSVWFNSNARDAAMSRGAIRSA